jgi:hypothetical protein
MKFLYAALPPFPSHRRLYNFQKLHDITKVLAFNLNCIIDVNYYAILICATVPLTSVCRTRGCFHGPAYAIQLASRQVLNIQIFKTIYRAAVEVGCEMPRMVLMGCGLGALLSKAGFNMTSGGCCKIRIEDLAALHTYANYLDRSDC